MEKSGHHHHHHHHHHQTSASEGGLRMKRIYWISIILNLLFVGVEFCIGMIGNSLGLIADAGHNLGDVFSLFLALFAMHLTTTHGTKRFTYGFKKSSVLISLINAIILLVAVGGIAVESIRRLTVIVGDLGIGTDGSLISWTAGVGIVVNGVTAWLLSKGAKDINQRGAFLHMLADTLVSVGVVISGVVIMLTGWVVVDPLVSLAIAVGLLWSSWGLLKESVMLTIDAVPEGVETDEVRNWMLEAEDVEDVHHVHVWAISTCETALTAHIAIRDKENLEKTMREVKAKLREHGITHSTLEVETERSECNEREC